MDTSSNLMGMIVGVMIRFATEMITSITLSPIIAGSAILAFLLSSRFLKKVPPALSALIIAVLLALKDYLYFDYACGSY